MKAEEYLEDDEYVWETWQITAVDKKYSPENKKWVELNRALKALQLKEQEFNNLKAFYKDMIRKHKRIVNQKEVQPKMKAEGYLKDKKEQTAECFYSRPNDNKGFWVWFSDGHTEFWNNSRIEAELIHRGLDFLNTQVYFREQYIQELKEALQLKEQEVIERSRCYIQ